MTLRRVKAEAAAAVVGIGGAMLAFIMAAGCWVALDAVLEVFRG